MQTIVRDSPATLTPAQFAGAMNFLAPPLEHLVRRIGNTRARHEALFGPLETIARRESPARRIHALHTELVHASRATNDVDQAIGRTLRRFRNVDGVARMGYARLCDYVRERLGQSLRWSQERARLDRLFEDSPLAARTHARGELTTSHLLAIAPMITAETDTAWIAVAKEKTVRELKLAVRDAKAEGRRVPEGFDEPAHALPPLPVDDGSEEPETGEWVSIPAPAAIANLFDHTIDIARRTAGAQLAVSACIEHILAEYGADPSPADHDDEFCASQSSITRGIAAAREKRLEVQHDRWRALAVPARGSTDGAAVASPTATHSPPVVSSLAAVSPPTPDVPAPAPPTPRALDAELRRLILINQRRHDHLAGLLAEFRAAEGWRTLGFASLGHYCREVLGISQRLAQELDRVATRLETLPMLAAARARGELSWTKLRLVTAVARPDTESAWLDRARLTTVRYLEREVHAAHHRRETDPAGWSRDGTPGPLTFNAPYGDESPVRPGAGLWSPTHTSAPDTTPDAAPAAAPDATSDAAPDATPNTTPDGPAHTYAPTTIIELPCRIRFWLPSTLSDWWHATDRAIRDTLDPNPHAHADASATKRHPPSAPWQRLLVLLRHYLEQWDTAAYENWSKGAETHRRFGWMCACPGCTARRNLENHHIDFRSRGGSDDPCNLGSLCAKHHRHILHESNALQVTGRSDEGLVWTLPAATYRGDVRITTVTTPPTTRSC